MIYTLKDYQFKAVESLKERFRLYFKELDENRITSAQLVFKAPTGSGKTYIVTSLIEDLAEEFADDNFCVIWACPGKGDLHVQSLDAVKTYLGGNPICSLLEDEFFGSRKYINNKEIVFVNWEKLIMKDRETGKWANNLMKDQEGMSFVNVLDQTRINGTKIVLIVDESHIGAGINARIKEFRDTIIIPQITLEMSATPLSDHIDVEVNPQDVIDEGMIKKDVIVNEGISKEDRSLEDKDSEQLILEKGYEKRNELQKAYEAIGSVVNPLVLIQIPNVEAGEAKKQVICDFLQDKGVTLSNGKLKMWCDDHDPFDKKAIKKNTDATQYLIFKTAVATGWDCPRAQVLIKFREGHSETFETQTIGRILRTPEAKSYDDPLLDNAYIFTNVKDFETKQDSYNPNRIKTEFSKMRKGFNKLSVYGQTQLESFYRSRMGDYNSADSNFNAYFTASFMKYFGLSDKDKFSFGDANEEKLKAKGLIVDVLTKDQLIEETHLDVTKADEEHSVSSDSAIVKMSQNDIQAQYYSIIKDNLNGLAYVRSKSPINTAIIDCLSTFYNVFSRSDKIICYQQIMIKNPDIFSQILNESTLGFREELQKNAGKKGDHYQFKIEEVRPYSIETHAPIIAPKSLYQPLFVLKDDQGNPDNDLEKGFLAYLDNQDEVDWYWENGTELMRVNFGISYNGGLNTFQPDFIVRFKNGKVGIFDTKPIGYRVEDTKVKAEALFEYVEGINFNRGYAPKVIGGIVVKQGSQYLYYLGREYHDFNENHADWKNFNDLLFEINTDLEAKKRVEEFAKACEKK